MREPGLEIEAAGDGFIVYDEGRERVHYLNHTAALVFELSTGKLDVRAISEWIAEVYGLEDPPIEDVESALEELDAEQLISESTGSSGVAAQAT
ncbi:MAG: PqqD family protein [Acidobacteriota bacterium]